MPRKRQQRGGPTTQGNQREGPLTVFVHIPKTAGTTLLEVLRRNFPTGVVSAGNVFKGRGGVDARPRDGLALKSRNADVLTGHIPYGTHRLLPADTRFVTLLRDPVERTLSQYHGLVYKGMALPGDGSLEAVLADGEVIFDNLQTRMLADSDQPFGAVDAAMLEQAKRNLSSGFAAFGLSERFDESLVLVARLLGLTTIVYTAERVADRPRGSDVSEEDVRLAQEHNRFDIDLYRWARQAFEETIARQDLDFALDVAALRAALGRSAPPVPDLLATVDSEALWERLVRLRTELLVERDDAARARHAGTRGMRDALVALRDELRDLNAQVGGAPSSPPEPAAPARAGGRKAKTGAKTKARAARSPAASGEPAKSERPAKARRAGKRTSPEHIAARGAEVAKVREGLAARLSAINEQIETADEETAVLLKIEAARIEKRVEQLSARVTQIEARVRQAGGGTDAGAAPAE